MPNQRVVVLTDEQISACVGALAESKDCSIGAATAEAELRSILKYSKEHPEGITTEMVERGWRGVDDPKGVIGTKHVRQILEAALGAKT